ncbi:unnamed protein product, partial [Thlaspi arvense]
VFFIINSSNALLSFNIQRYGPRGYNRLDSAISDGLVISMRLKSLSNGLHSPYWILFAKVNHISVYGKTIDARGAGYWSCKKKGGQCPQGAFVSKPDFNLFFSLAILSISFSWCDNVLLSGLTSLNSHNIHVTVHHSSNVGIQNIRIRASSESPNTDGIVVQSSSRVTISWPIIKTGDDCSALDQGSTNIWIERVVCGPGHGIRIKAWARPSGGFVRDVEFRSLIMRNVGNPLIIDQNYCPGRKGCPNQNSGVKISGVTFANIKGTSTTPIAMKLDCSDSNHCTGIRLQNINLTYMRGPSDSHCTNAHGRASGVMVPRNCM